MPPPGQSIAKGDAPARRRDREDRQLGRGAGLRHAAPDPRRRGRHGSGRRVDRRRCRDGRRRTPRSTRSSPRSSRRTRASSLTPAVRRPRLAAPAPAQAAPSPPANLSVRVARANSASARSPVGWPRSSASTSSRIKGTGTHGRVSKEDVEAYAASLQGGAAASAPDVPAGTSGPCPDAGKDDLDARNDRATPARVQAVDPALSPRHRRRADRPACASRRG